MVDVRFANKQESNMTTLEQQMQHKLAKLAMPAEITLKAELIEKINALKKQRNAIILGHNYMEPALFHFAADITGDSLELCRRAAKTDCDIIVFAGVRFMAETAKIINPSKMVLIPSLAGCSLAASITAEDVRQLKKQYPGVPVVTYVNCYAEVKAETDICCTSSNAVKVVQSLASNKVIFLPDEYLARNVARETGKTLIVAGANGVREIAHDTMIAWPGKCEVHEKFTVKDIKNVRRQYDNVLVLAHPECPPDVVEAADFSGSTSQIVNYVKQHDAERYLLLTECSMGDNIIAENPEKEVLRLCSVRCPHMNEITLEQTLASLQEMKHVIEVDQEIIEKGRAAVDRMLAIG